jgi:1,4-dihydroxy-2-naphthoate octaprenyltransferase
MTELRPMQNVSIENDRPTARWKTVSRKDPEFFSYLEGSFSTTYRALPVRSLNVDSMSEQVTFEIKPISEIRWPGLFRAVWQLMRPYSVILSAAPMLAIYFFCLVRDIGLKHFQNLIALSSFAGVIFFHIALNLFNDYGDHIRGRDRLRPRGGSRVIQKGWLTAKDVRIWAWVWACAALLCGLPAIFFAGGNFNFDLIVVSICALVGFEFAFQKLGLKYRGWAEITGFALTGPLLAAAFAWAISGRLYWGELLLGSFFGSIALMYFHSANLENIMADSQAGVRTWATRAGFDASKRFFVFTAMLSMSCLIVYAIFFESSHLFAVLVFLYGAGMLLLSERVVGLASPLSSRLMGLRRSVLIGELLVTIALILAFLVARKGHTW